MGDSVKAAIYMRLSRDDNESGESQSIGNQRDFLLEYCRDRDIAITGEYTDDGYSGLDYNRPGFIKLLADIENGLVNTVITRDLSRLGRDYILTGHYIERYFPEHNVRYIAVTDNVDTLSEAQSGDLLPMRAVINDMYAKDISKKVRSSLGIKKRMGKFIGPFAPYGYTKDENDKGHLIIDREQSKTVTRIFSMFLAGETFSGIAEALNSLNIPPPIAVKGKNYTGSGWNPAIIKRILSNPTYSGNLTQNRSKKINYKLKKVVLLPPEQWITVDGTHEAIVPNEVFLLAKERLKTRGYTKNRTEVRLYSGLVFCGGCKSPMYSVKEGEGRHYLVCSNWRRNGVKSVCHSHCIREERLSEAVWERLLELAKAIPTSEILKSADEAAKRSGSRRLCEKREELKKAKNTLLSFLRQLGVESGDNGIYSDILLELKGDCERLTAELSALERKNGGDKAADLRLASLITGKTPDRRLLLALVKKIEVGEDKVVTVHLNCTRPER